MSSRTTKPTLCNANTCLSPSGSSTAACAHCSQRRKAKGPTTFADTVAISNHRAAARRIRNKEKREAAGIA